MSQSVCKCGKMIVWATGPKGNKIPLDPAPPTYVVDPEGHAVRSVAMVNHFATCPLANEFKKKPEEAS
jgi:hypothetical protein